MAVNKVDYRGNLINITSPDTSRGPSMNLWADCPVAEIIEDAGRGIYFFDDFLSFGLQATQTTQIQVDKYKLYCASAGIWTPDAMPHTTTPGAVGGIISGLCDTDGDSMAIGTYSCPFLLTTTQQGKLWFEARIATTSILTNMGQLFVGLGENFVSAFDTDSPLDNANAVSAELAMIGFNRLEDGLGVLNTSYADHAAAWTNIQASANTTLAANTWIKLGMLWDPSNSSACVRFFVDGVETSTPMTKAALLALTHLDAKGLGPLLAFYADSAGTADYVYLDWWRVAQTFN